MKNLFPESVRTWVRRAAPVTLIGAGLLHAAPQAVSGPASGDDLTGLSLDELTKVEVTSVARKDQQLMKVAAAVYVITAEEIRRSGASGVPDLLRMVPGLQVAQVTADVWAISARGFNSRSSNKILVLIDGRSVYNNLYSGTFWDQNQVALDDIERIEVIRGPGATMWGANAVDGVISIVTKKATETQGLRISTEAGQNQLPDTEVRYGGHSGDNLQYRVETAFTENEPLLTGAGANAADRWNSGRAGLRMDWQLTDRDTFSLDGQYYTGYGNEPVNLAFPLPSSLVTADSFHFSGGFVRGRWERQLRRSDLALQISYTSEARGEWISHGVLATTDVDFQHHIRLGPRNDFNWGGGYRFYDDDGIGLLSEARLTESLLSAFAQDELTLIPSRLSFTAGVKLQDFHSSAVNRSYVQPQGRLLWTPSKSDSLWAAVSKAVRTPSESEEYIDIPFALPAQNGIPAEGVILGNPALPGEVLIAYEAGYRRQIGKRISLDAAAFYNHYSQLIQTVEAAPYFVASPDPEIIAPQTYVASGKANTRGVEFAGSWAARRNLRLQVSYAWESASFDSPPSLALSVPPGASWATPLHTVDVRAAWDVTRRWSLDSFVYGVTSLVGEAVPGYVRVDLRLARKVAEGGEISAGVQNLLNDRHLEILSGDYLVSSYMRRNAYVKIVWRF